jgi:hypothetical protein
MFLVVRNLRTDVAPGALYAVYLDLPPNPTPEQRKAHAVGAINFFHAHPAQPQAAAHEGMAAAHSAAASFDVTDLVKRLREAGELAEQPAVTVVPIGQPDAAAKPSVGDVSIVEI